MKAEDVRDLFPITERWLYFDAASLSPYCTPVVDALKAFSVERLDFASLYYDRWYGEIEDCRRLAAELINASPEEVALTKNTSEGVNLAAGLVDWRKGDEVVVCGCDFPTNVYPFLNLRRRGVAPRYVECRDGTVAVEDIEAVLTERTRLLSISHVLYGSGYRLDLREIGRICREKDVLLHVDAAQSLGAIKVDVKEAGADFLSAPGYKWLLSPLGTGLFYVRKEHLEGVEPPVVGWLSVNEPEKLDTRGFELLPGAARFEAGNKNIGGFLGMKAALQLISSIGQRQIEKRVLGLSEALADELDRSGLKVLSHMEPEHRSGIVCIEKGKLTRGFLRKHRIVATIRRNLRLSPHIYNTEEEAAEVAGTLSR